MAISVSGCMGPGEYWEPRTFGVRNSKWQQMTPENQYAIEVLYHEKQRLAEQIRLNDLKQKQANKVAKAIRKNAASQQDRLKDEHANLKQQIEDNALKQQNISSIEKG